MTVACLEAVLLGSRLGGRESKNVRSLVEAGCAGRRLPETSRMEGARQLKTFFSKLPRLKPSVPPE